MGVGGELFLCLNRYGVFGFLRSQRPKQWGKSVSDIQLVGELAFGRKTKLHWRICFLNSSVGVMCAMNSFFADVTGSPAMDGGRRRVDA